MNEANILLVEDEAIVALQIETCLKARGYSVSAVAASGKEALRCVANEEFDIVLMDIHLRGEIDGIETAERIASIRGIPIVYLTAFADQQTLERASGTSPFGYMVNPKYTYKSSINETYEISKGSNKT